MPHLQRPAERPQLDLCASPEPQISFYTSSCKAPRLACWLFGVTGHLAELLEERHPGQRSVDDVPVENRHRVRHCNQ